MFSNIFFLNRIIQSKYRYKIFVAILFFLVVTENTPATPIISNITGVVLDSETSDAIPNAVIQVMKSDIFATSRNDGSFLIENLKEEVYQLKISHMAYHEKIITIEISEKSNKSLIIYLTPKTIDLSEVLVTDQYHVCLLYTSPSPRDRTRSRMPSSA